MTLCTKYVFWNRNLAMQYLLDTITLVRHFTDQGNLISHLKHINPIFQKQLFEMIFDKLIIKVFFPFTGEIKVRVTRLEPSGLSRVEKNMGNSQALKLIEKIWNSFRSVN